MDNQRSDSEWVPHMGKDEWTTVDLLNEDMGAMEQFVNKLQWSPLRHELCSDAARERVRTVLIVAMRLYSTATEETPVLPLELWLAVLRSCNVGLL